MGVIGVKNSLSGMVGDVVVREFNGKKIMQSRPRKHKKSKAVQESSTEFVYASRFGKDLREKLSSVLMKYQDVNMYRRFLSALYKTLQMNDEYPKGERRFSNTDLSPLVGFDFNINSPWSEYATVPMKFNRVSKTSLEVEISKQETSKGIYFPDYSSQVELVLVCYSYAESSSEPHEESVFKMPIKEGKGIEEAISFSFDIASDATLVFVVATLFYEDNRSKVVKSYMNNIDLHPCQLVYAESGGA